METEIDKVVIKGVTYVPESTITKVPEGNRFVVVIDRGWIYAGDLEEKDGRIKLYRPVLIRRP